jgi:hypothetical protein
MWSFSKNAIDNAVLRVLARRVDLRQPLIASGSRRIPGNSAVVLMANI